MLTINLNLAHISHPASHLAMPPTTMNFFWGCLVDVLLEFTIANLTFDIDEEMKKERK